jgi:hypothetical protein
MRLDHPLATRFARSTLGHVGREYPHALQHVLVGPEEVRPGRIHPIFHGSFDWHSCVHAWWQLFRLARLFPDLAPEIYPRADEAITPVKAEGEREYLLRQPSFERPYGWGWLLALHVETERHPGPWADALEPLATLIAERFQFYLSNLTFPVRSGTHANTAFALILALDWADTHAPAFAAQIRDWSNARFAGDLNAAHQEPGGEDFLSPTLTEAHLMAKCLPTGDFERWVATFMPELPLNLLEPVVVSDRSDGRIGHLDGLNLSRAWHWRSLAEFLPSIVNSSAERHIEAALPHVAENYMSEHWLATFALLALSAETIPKEYMTPT